MSILDKAQKKLVKLDKKVRMGDNIKFKIKAGNKMTLAKTTSIKDITIHEISVGINLFESLINRAIFNHCSIVLFEDTNPDKFTMEVAELARRHSDTVTIYKTLEGKPLFASDYHTNPYKVKVIASVMKDEDEDEDEGETSESAYNTKNVIEELESAGFFVLDEGAGDELTIYISNSKEEFAQDIYVCVILDNGEYVDTVNSGNYKELYPTQYANIETTFKEQDDSAATGVKMESLAALMPVDKKLETIKKIVEKGQYAKIDGQIVDGTTANMLMQVIGALSDENKQKFLSMPIIKMVDIGWKCCKASNAATAEDMNAVFEEACKEDNDTKPKTEASPRVRTLWKDENHKSLDKAWKAAEINMEVNKVNDQYQYRLWKSPGYPDNSGMGTILYGYADSEKEGFEKAEKEFKKHDIKEMLNSRHVNPTYDPADTIKKAMASAGKPLKSGQSEALHPDQKGGQELKLQRIKEKHIDQIANHANTGIVKHAILDGKLSDLNPEQIASVRKALVEVGHRNMGHDRNKGEDDSGKGSVGSDIAEWAAWISSDTMGKLADYLSDSIGDRNAKDTYLFAKDKMETALLDFYRNDMNKSNYADTYDFWQDIIYTKKAISYTEEDDFNTFYFKEPMTDEQIKKLSEEIATKFKTETAIVDNSALNVYHMNVNGIADVAKHIGQNKIVEIA